MTDKIEEQPPQKKKKYGSDVNIVKQMAKEFTGLYNQMCEIS
jgi:hypothetical protein